MSLTNGVSIIVALCFVLSTCAQAEFHVQQFNTETEAIEGLHAAIANGYALENGIKDVAAAMERGYFELAEKLIAASHEFGVQLSTPVYQQASKIRRKLQQLTESLQKQNFAKG